MNSLIYKKIFIYSSLQFCGNIEEYFSTHSEKLVVFIVMPRLKNSGNLVRVYLKGKLVEEQTVLLSENIFLYYFLWLYNHWKILLKYFSYDEKFHVIAGHPVSYIGLFLQKIIRHRVKFIYWMGDYFPGDGLVIKAFERVKKFYHDRADYNLYLSDGINQVLNNGKTINNSKKKTVMWGVKPVISGKKSVNKFTILFVGLVKESQGLEEVFSLLKNYQNYTLKIVGICDDRLYKKYKKIIASYKIKDRVDFPNRFFSDGELEKVASKSHVGIALYDTSDSNPTYYTDPGKVKTYSQLGLPVVMSNTSGVVPFINKFRSGVVVKSVQDVAGAVQKIKGNYQAYLEGVEKFNRYFNTESYYREKFKFMESHGR